jgi:hypothetical protein
MIRAQLLPLLQRAAPDLPDPDHPRFAALLEAAAEAAPSDAALRAAAHAAHGELTAAQGLSPVVSGVLRDRLVRWDDWTTTWEGTDALSGRRAQVRALRPHAQRDPWLRRALLRDASALRPVLPELRVDADLGALITPLPGPRFQDAPAGGRAGAEALVRMVTRTIDHLSAYDEAGLGLDHLAPEELLDAGTHLAVVTLTPQPMGDAGPALGRIARLMLGWWRDAAEHPLADLLAGFADLPPRTVGDAVALVRETLAAALTAELHAVRRRSRDKHHEADRRRLAATLERLARALPPPRGRAAVGLDLEGRTLVVQCYSDAVWWGAVGEAPEAVWAEEAGFDVSLARRLLRVRGSAPVNEKLNREVEGTPAYVDRITRWTAAQLDLRALRLLLHREEDALP